MSTAEYQPPQELKSKIKIGSNSKGDPVVEVSVREGTTDTELDRIRRLAVTAYRETCKEVREP